MITLNALSIAVSIMSGNTDVLTIEQAVAIALRNSYAVKNAQETVTSH